MMIRYNIYGQLRKRNNLIQYRIVVLLQSSVFYNPLWEAQLFRFPNLGEREEGRGGEGKYRGNDLVKLGKSAVFLSHAWIDAISGGTCLIRKGCN